METKYSNDMNWKIGQKLVCVKKGLWRREYDYGYDSYGPSYMEVCTFYGFKDDCIYLNEYPYDPFLELRPSFDRIQFRPLLGDSAQAELISSFTEIKEGSDLPIRMPQPETV